MPGVKVSNLKLSFGKQRDIEQAGREWQTNLVAIIAIHFLKPRWPSLQFHFLVDMALALIRMTWRLFSMMMEDLRLLTQYRPYFRISFCCSDWKSFLGIQFGSQQPVKDPHQKLTSKPHVGQTIVEKEKRISFERLSASTSMSGMKYHQLVHCINCQPTN